MFLHVLLVKLDLDKCGVTPKRPNHTLQSYCNRFGEEAQIVVDGRNYPILTGSFRICHLSTRDYQSLSHMCLVAWKHQGGKSDGRTPANHLGCVNLVVNLKPTFNLNWFGGLRDPSGSVVLCLDVIGKTTIPV